MAKHGQGDPLEICRGAKILALKPGAHNRFGGKKFACHVNGADKQTSVSIVGVIDADCLDMVAANRIARIKTRGDQAGVSVVSDKGTFHVALKMNGSDATTIASLLVAQLRQERAVEFQRFGN